MQVLFFIFVFFIFFSNANASPWKLKREYGDTIIYTSDNGTRLTLNYRTTVPKNNKKFSEKFIQDLEQDKKKLLSMIGIRQWKVEKRRVVRNKKQTNIKLSGSYRDNSNNRIYFVEYHFYSDSSKLQALLTNKIKTLLKKDAKLSKLKGFQTKYGF